MDPASALGVASAAIAFVDFSFKALAFCREIRDDASGSTVSNKAAEAYTRTVRDLSTELRNGVPGHATASRRINSVARELVIISEELLDVLAKVRAAGNGNFARAAQTTFRALKERKTIEKLQVRLEKQQSLLDSAVLHDLRARFTDVMLEQTKLLSGLNSRTRDLICRLQDQHTSSQHQWDDISSALTKAGAENEAFHQLSLAKNDEVLHAVVDVQSSVQSHLADMKHIDGHEELLRSLFYPEITARKEILKPPWEKTFDWIFEEQNEPRWFGRWSSFPEWLSKGMDVYWISGKAGSGKSTLMAHIINERRTKLLLAGWAKGQQLCNPSYFFWRPGSQEQKSITGLLRSLLFQVLEEVPSLARTLLARFPLAKGRVAAWSVPRLVQQLQYALQSATDHRFCFFIDGLDEFEGDFNEVLDVMAGMQQGSHVKCCLSSRPEVAMVVRLSAFARLRMEDLNYPDISCYVTETLARHVSNHAVAAILAPGVIRHVQSNKFGEKISDRAEGVFLWAALATQSIIRGLQSSDDEATLDARLEDIPSEMATLFKYMLGNVETVHKQSLAYCFQLIHFYQKSVSWEPLTVGALTAAKLQSDIQSYDEYLAACRRTEHQLQARRRGLLVVSHTYNSMWNDKIWYAPCLNRTASRTQEAFDRATVVSNRSCFKYTDVIDYRLLEQQDRSIDWVHRSAYEFVCHGEGAEMFAAHQQAQADVHSSLREGSLKRLVALPTMNTWDLIRLALKADSFDQARLHQHLDEPRQLLSHFSLHELTGSRWTSMQSLPAHVVPHYLHDCYYRQVPFWTECMSEGLTTYIRSHLEDMKSQPESTFILVATLCSFCGGIGSTNYENKLGPAQSELLSEILAIVDNQLVQPFSNLKNRTSDRCESDQLELSFGEGKRACTVSWDAASFSEVLNTLAPTLVLSLFEANCAWLQVVEQHVRAMTIQQLSVLNAFYVLLDNLNVRFACNPPRSGPQVITWLPAAAMSLWIIRSRDDIPERIVDGLLDSSMGVQLEFRHSNAHECPADGKANGASFTTPRVVHPLRWNLSH